MPTNDDPLVNYIQTLLEIQSREADRPLTEKDLEDAARDLGWTDEEWARLERTFERHLRIAGGFARFGNWTDAAAELEKAVALKPTHVEARFRLAEALVRKDQRKGRAEELARAERLAREVLSAAPSHEGALRLISEMRDRPQAPANVGPAWLRGRSATVLGAAAVLLLLAVLAVFLLLDRSGPEPEEAPAVVEVPPEPTGPEEAPESPESEAAPTPAKAPTEPEAPEAPNPAAAPNALPEAQPPPVTRVSPPVESIPIPDRNTMPVVWEAPAELTLNVVSSRFKPFDSSYSYTLNALLVPHGVELDQLSVRLAILDADGEVLAEDDAEVLGTHHPATRPGDTVPMGLLIYEEGAPPQPEKARVSVVSIDRRPAQESYAPPPVVELEWPDGRPPDVDLVVRERQSTYSPSPALGETFHHLDLSVENTGQASLTLLKFEITWYDPDGEIVNRRSQYAASTSGPRLSPGQRRAVGGTYGLPLMEPGIRYTYRISVAEVRY